MGNFFSNIVAYLQVNLSLSKANIFDNAIPQNNKEDEIKELEMFEDNNQEEDFEIPAFLRKQKN